MNSTYRNQPVSGALFVLGASFGVALVGTLVKVVSVTLPNEMVVFFRNLFALMFVLPWIRYNRPAGGIRTRCFRFHLLRSMAGLIAIYCFFYAIGHLQLGEAFLLLATSPLFIPVIAALWLREPVTKKVRLALAIGFLGIMLILKPGTGIFQPAAVIGLGAGVLGAVAMVTIRRMSTSEPAIRIVFYFMLLSTAASTGPLIWSWQTPGLENLALLALIGLLAVITQYLLTKGYSFAPAAQIGSFSYAYIVFSTFFGWLFWDEKLDGLTWIGAVLICVGGIVAAYKADSQPVSAVADELSGESAAKIKGRSRQAQQKEKS